MTYESSKAHRPASDHPWRTGKPAPPRSISPYPLAKPTQQPVTPPAPRHWWSAQRVMMETGLSRTAVNRLCREGKLVGKLVPGQGKQGHIRMVDPASVRAYKEERRRRWEQVEANVPNRSHANNHGWPIAEYSKKIRGEA